MNVSESSTHLSSTHVSSILTSSVESSEVTSQTPTSTQIPTSTSETPTSTSQTPTTSETPSTSSLPPTSTSEQPTTSSVPSSTFVPSTTSETPTTTSLPPTTSSLPPSTSSLPTSFSSLSSFISSTFSTSFLSSVESSAFFDTSSSEVSSSFEPSSSFIPSSSFSSSEAPSSSFPQTTFSSSFVESSSSIFIAPVTSSTTSSSSSSTTESSTESSTSEHSTTSSTSESSTESSTSTTESSSTEHSTTSHSTSTITSSSSTTSSDPTDASVIDTVETFTHTVNGEVVTTIITGRATVTPTAAIAQATAASSGGGGGLHGGSKTAVAVVVPIGGVALISAAAFYFWKKKSRKTFADQRLSTSSRSHSPSDSFSNTLSTTQLAGGSAVPQYRGWDMTGGGAGAGAAANGVNGSINSGSGSGLGLVTASGAAVGAATTAGLASSASSTTAVGPTRTHSRGAASRTHSRAASLSMGPIDEDLDDAVPGDPFKMAETEEYEPSPDTHGLNMNTQHQRRASNFSSYSMNGDSPPISQESTTMKFGKYLAKRQLEVPEYGNYFINYKALKKLIKSLSNQAAAGGNVEQALRDNKATFFFRLERELEKVNSFYLQKEAELKLRIDILMEKKADAYASGSLTSSTSVSYISLYEGFQRFRRDLSKLEQFIELNATGFSKVLKKWDKRSKQQTKELYLSRAVEVQPVFHRDILARLSDQASSSILELEAWADGDVIFDDSRRGSEITQVTTAPVTAPVAPVTAPGAKDDDLYYEFVETASAENVTTADISEWVEVLKKVRDAKSRVTRIFLLSISTSASNAALLALYESGLVDLNASDALNGRNVLHEAAMTTAIDRTAILELALSQGVSLLARDFYGRTPLHYACLHNQRKMLKMFVDAGAEVNALDKDNFTPLLYSVINQYSDCVRDLISMGASVDAVSDNGYIPLNLACQYGVYDASEIILQNSPRHEPDAEGLFALHIAARAGHSSLVSLLLKYDADVNELDKLNRWTALFHSANEGHEHVLETLLTAGARTDILDEERHSALYYAAWEGHVKCMHRLADLEATVKLQEVDIDMQPAEDVVINDAALDELDGIPDLSLPPPILPFRRYGHNFLDQKIFVLITLAGSTPVKFVSEEATLSSGQLRISSKSDHSVIPRSVPLAMSDTDRAMSFQLDSLDDFALDFEIFPTFGTRIIAKTAALPYIWRATLTQFHQSYTLPLFDMRLHTIGEMAFDVQVVRPYKGTPLEITKYDTYWKSTGTSQQSLSFVTASSVSGQYARLTVCVTSDGVPVVTPSWKVDVGHGIRIGVNTLTYDELKKCTHSVHNDLSTVSDPTEVHRVLANATSPLSEVLKLLPTTVKLDLNVIFAASDLNHYVDTILDVLFAHARETHDTNRMSNGDPAPRATRSIILSSVNPDVCTALNWKQPNYPVFFVMRNGTFQEPTDLDRVSVSVKEAVLFANGNNMLGLVCDARLLNLVPALVESICSSGLVLVSDGEHECKGVKAMRNDSVVEFHNSIDV